MLNGLTIAVPESRELATLARLLRNRGAEVLEVPLVSILDAPDPEPVVAWLERFISQPPGLLILLTGEGLRRLLDLAAKRGLKEQFLGVLALIPILSRGPKPERVLRENGISTSRQAVAPTTAGVIESLGCLSLAGQKVAVQLYGEEQNLPLQAALVTAGASVDVVAPYVYASEADEHKVIAFINTLALGKLDAVAFTSQPQLHRLTRVASLHHVEELLQQGMANTVVAAVGPVVKEQLELAGFRVSIMPERVYFMKPLVTAISRYFETAGKVPYNPDPLT